MFLEVTTGDDDLTLHRKTLHIFLYLFEHIYTYFDPRYRLKNLHLISYLTRRRFL